jgi:hypothetical protein
VALAPLATGADLSARGITPDATSPAFLDEASAVVREAAGCPISLTTLTVDLFPDWHDRFLRLPVQPVVSVTSITVDGIAVPTWVYRNGGLYLPQWKSYLEQFGIHYDAIRYLPPTVTVTYVSGIDPVPSDIIGLVCNLAAAAMSAAASGSLGRDPRVQATAIDDFRESYRIDAEAPASAISLPAGARRLLAARFGNGPGVVTFR